MSGSSNNGKVLLDDCGCCEGLSEETPLKIFNRPGLQAIAYRIGEYEDFKASMLAQLSHADYPQLQKLKTRSTDDYSIALLDAWSMVADILTFYDQYQANEKYLRTAKERLSVIELARLIGYIPHPGVAASTILAFTMDEMPGAPERVKLVVGTKVQSTPKQDEKAQIYETSQEVEARVAWNKIRPRLKRQQILSNSSRQILFDGTDTSLRPGHALLFHPGGQGDKNVFANVSAVELDQDANRTLVSILPVATDSIHGFESLITTPPLVGAPPLPEGNYLYQTLTSAELEADADEHKYQIQDVFAGLSVDTPAEYSVRAYRQSSATFGHNAPAWNSLPESLKGDAPTFDSNGDAVVVSGFTEGPYKYDEDIWPGGKSENLNRMRSNNCPKGSKPLAEAVAIEFATDVSPASLAFEISGNTSFSPSVEVADTVTDFDSNPLDIAPTPDWLFLDAEYNGVDTNAPVILKDGSTWGQYAVSSVNHLSKSCFTITAKVTRLGLVDAVKLTEFTIRGTQVYFDSERLPIADVPITDPVPVNGEQTLELNGFVDGLQEGQTVLLSGAELGGSEQRKSEFITLDKIEHQLVPGGATTITFSPALTRIYRRDTVEINANVTQATHGETTEEVFGSGDASRAYQSFTLKQSPLTRVSAATASGEKSTLEVRVNNIKWREVTRLYGAKPTDKVYSLHTNDAGETEMKFGNGELGARLSSGQNNVRGRYRKGIGIEGLVGANQLNMLMSRPLGLKDVTNPHASTGAADPEPLSEARVNAPLTVLTLDRAVSLKDFEDFCRAFAGISKALAVPIQTSTGKAVHITVAGPNGASITTSSETYKNLLLALRASGDPLAIFSVQSYRAATFRLAAKLRIDPDYLDTEVLEQVSAALRYHFSFAQRAFGQSVNVSEVAAVMQNINGVIAVDLDYLYRGATQKLSMRINATQPGVKANGQTRAAEILTLHPGPYDYLEVIK